MQITVFGAGGRVGSLVIEAALKRGYRVIAFVHSRDLFSPSGNLVVQKGDIYNQTDVAQALRGSDAVVSCLGSWGTPKRNVLTAAMRNIIPAMDEYKINRIITLTGSGAAAPGQKGHPLFLKLLSPFPAGKVFADGEEHMKLLAACKLSWTTVRSPIMTGAGDTAYVLNLKSAGPIVARKAVAAALLNQVEATDFLNQAPYIRRS